MKAMVLAAGLGTRLRPLTNDRPKTLVTVGGRTMLEIVLARLRQFGVTEVIVNTHHYAEMIREYLKANGDFGMRIEISREEELLDTGGGLKKAAWFFLEGDGGPSQNPFIVHNVDVISTIDLAEMVRFHKEQGALATLAMQDRETKRYLLFDEKGLLCGRRAGGNGEPEYVRSGTSAQALAFCGIHILTHKIFAKMKETGAFSIIDAYLHLAAQGEKIAGFRADAYRWRDLGRPGAVAQTAEEMESGTFSAN
ncbi:MAG: nucleotidyltransferase family protein [Terracidiphilus sp.]